VREMETFENVTHKASEKIKIKHTENIEKNSEKQNIDVDHIEWESHAHRESEEGKAGNVAAVEDLHEECPSNGDTNEFSLDFEFGGDLKVA
jgi:hypothetical protein